MLKMENEKVFKIFNDLKEHGTTSDIVFTDLGAVIKIKTVITDPYGKLENEIWLMRWNFETIIKHYMSEKKGGE